MSGSRYFLAALNMYVFWYEKFYSAREKTKAMHLNRSNG
jgi:hypothetical protein